MSRRLLLGSTVASVVAFGMACSSQPPSPTSPSSVVPAAVSPAGPGGSTLKSTAPVPISPTGNEEIESRTPTLWAGNASGIYGTGSFQYRFQVMDASGNVIREGTVAPGTDRTGFPITEELPAPASFTWRVRAEQEGYVGPWSDSATFRTKEPVVIKPPTPLSPIGGVTTTTTAPNFVVTNGEVTGPAVRVIYQIQVSTTQTFDEITASGSVERGSGATTTHDVGTLPNSQLFYWRARGKDEGVTGARSEGVTGDKDVAVTGDWSNVESFRTPAPAPGLSCPADMSAQSSDGNPISVSFTTPVPSDGEPPVSTSCDAPAKFSVGTTTVTCTATDGVSRTASCNFKVTVTSPTGTKGPYGPERTIGEHEVLSIIRNVHDKLGYNLGSSSSRNSRVDWLWTAMAVVHYGHYKYNPSGGDRKWCVKDGGPGRPPSDDVIVRCDSREAWDTVGGAGANGYRFHLDYIGKLPGVQNVYPPPVKNLPN